MRDHDPRVAVVVVTRDRAPELLGALGRLRSLPERPGIVVVDNASSDGTPDEVRRHHPDVEVVALEENIGAAGRTVGVRRTETPYVAFSDDDSWWAPGSLGLAADLLDEYPGLGLVAARVLVGPEEREDPICAEMEDGPLPDEPDLPGRPVLGFLACAVAVRRTAFLEAGGFDNRLFFSGEEELLAVDMASAGWGLSYVKDLTVYHHPSNVRDRDANRRLSIRNALWIAWLRRPAGTVARRTWCAADAALRDAHSRSALAAAVQGLPWVLRRRRKAPPEVEEKLRKLDRGPRPLNGAG